MPGRRFSNGEVQALVVLESRSLHSESDGLRTRYRRTRSVGYAVGEDYLAADFRVTDLYLTNRDGRIVTSG